MKFGVLKRNVIQESLSGVESETDSLTQSMIFESQLSATFAKFKPFLEKEFWGWFEGLEFPTEVKEALNFAGAGTFYLHAFVFQFNWNAAEELWELSWSVDEKKLSPDFPLDRELAHTILIKTIDQSMVDKKHRRICQTYKPHVLTFEW